MCLQCPIDLVDNLGNRLDSLDFVDQDNNTCDYFTTVSDDIWSSSISDFISVQLNIRGLINKQAALINLINRIAGKEKVDLIMLQETWITQSNSHLVNIPEYCHYYQVLSGNKGGGVSILVSNELSSRDCTNLNINEPYMESISIEIKLPGKSLIASSIYRLPNTDSIKFNKTFHDTCKRISRKATHSIIGLDHNLDLLKAEKHSQTQLFLENILEQALIPCITCPTRITKSSATLIDNIIVNIEVYNNIQCGVLISDLSDHFPGIMTWNNIQKNKRDAVSFTAKKLDSKHYPSIKKELDVDWSCLTKTKSVNESSYSIIIFYLISKNILKRKTSRYHLKKQLKLYKDWLLNKNAILYDRYKQYRDMLKKIKQRQKHTFYVNQCERYKHNSKQLWCLINDVCSKNSDKTSSINYITIEGIKHYQSDKIKSEFVNHFSSIGAHLLNFTPQSVLGIETYLNKIQPNEKSIYMSPCTKHEI